MLKKFSLTIAVLLVASPMLISGPKKIIFDTDMGNDVDDCLAMEMLYSYIDDGKVNLLGILSSKREIGSVKYLDILNTYAGHPEIPLGITKTYPEEKHKFWKGDFATKISDSGKFAHSISDYESLPDAFKLMRQLLADNGGNRDITVVAVGFSTNLNRLMQSGPDEISPLSGLDLIKQNVNDLVIMAGDFHKPKTEYNVRCDVPAAKAILENWPSPVIISDHEIGFNMRIQLTEVHENFGDNHPVTEAFDMYLPNSTMPTERPLHDPAAVLFAVELSEKYASLSDFGTVEVRDDAMTFFTPSSEGTRRYILHNPKQQQAVINRIKHLTKQPQKILIEAESFEDKGAWSLDQQFMDQMGSPYLLAHGMGVPVSDASTKVVIPEDGTYYVYARTFNWTSPWSPKAGPGAFRITINGSRLHNILGSTGNKWEWQSAGSVKLKKGENVISLIDLTGFDGRCDAIFLTTRKGLTPPAEGRGLDAFRRACDALSISPSTGDKYDLVVVGGGIGGMCTAVSAARLGLKVALIHDRQVLGGNNSSEIRVHLGGSIELGKYPALGRMVREFGHSKMGNAKPAENYEDWKKIQFVKNESNITFFPLSRVVDVEMASPNSISAVIMRDLVNGQESRLKAALFCDCTGDGNIGYMSGADFRMGRESKEEYGESLAPEKADDMTMGCSVQWYSEDSGKKQSFPQFKYGLEINSENCEKVKMGEWTWETGMNRHQIDEAERLRDYMLLVIYSNWSYLKNESEYKNQYKTDKLAWVAYIAGRRESRRLLGDYVLSQEDVDKNVFHEDATFTTAWHFDLHFPDPKNTRHFPGEEFKAETKQNSIYPYAVPYRCLYSRNINNLFMAGRDISATHVAMGSTRLMRTIAMMGEVVGMAASICKKHDVLPRDVYQRYLPELKDLMKVGVARTDVDLPDNQHFNQSPILSEPLYKGGRK